MVTENELKMMWKDAVKILSWHLPEGMEEIVKTFVAKIPTRHLPNTSRSITT
jgi:hypothetical protein